MPLKWRHEPSIVPHIPSLLNQVTKITQNGLKLCLLPLLPLLPSLPHSLPRFLIRSIKMPLKLRHEPSIVSHIHSLLNRVTKITQNGSILPIFHTFSHLHSNSGLIGLEPNVLVWRSHWHAIPLLSPNWKPMSAWRSSWQLLTKTRLHSN
jgi:hypothetical protein